MADIQTSDGRSFTLIDADTITDGEQNYRIQGYNAPETAKVIPDEDKGLRFKRGQVGGAESTEAVRRIIAAGGFNNIEDLGYTDSFGRKRIRIKNDIGDDLTNTLYESGAIDPNLFTDEEGMQAAYAGRLERELKGKRLYEDIVTEEMGDIDRKPVTFKTTATNEKQYSQAVKEVVADQMGLDLADEADHRRAINIVQSGSYDPRSIPFSGIDFRKSDRTKEGVALNQMTSAWNTGWQGMATGLAGFAELAGVGLGIDALEKYGASEVRLAKEDLAEMPALKNLDYRDIDSIMDGWGFMTNNLAMSAPYLITLLAGTALAPVTGGASIPIAYGSTAATYAGQVWNDIVGPKGKSHAAGSIMAGTAMALLDRLGLKAIMKPSEFLTKAGRDKVIEALVAGGGVLGKGMTRDKAEELLATEGKKVIKETIEGMSNFASDNINNSGIIKDLMKRGLIGGGAEAITEAGQEGLGYTASAAMSEGGLDKHFNPNEFANLLAASAIAGGSLGSGFGMAGGAIEAGDRYATQKGLESGRIGQLGKLDQMAQEVGSEGSILNEVNNINNKVKDIKPTKSTSRTSDKYDQGKAARGTFIDKIKDPFKYVGELYRASSLVALNADVQRRSKNARIVASLIGTVAGKTYSGNDVQAAEAQMRSNLIEMINPKRMFRRFGMIDSVTNSQKISDMIKRYMNNDLNGFTQQDINNIQATINELKLFADAEYDLKNNVYKSQGNNRADLARGKDSWLNQKSWDWKKVRQNRDEWYKFMRKYNPKMSKQELDDLYLKVSNNEDATDFSVVEGIEFIPGGSKTSMDMLSSKPGYDLFANDNILQNLINQANQTAKYAAYTTYFGAGGKNLDYLLEKMETEDGLSREEVADIAFHVKNIIDAGTGNYNTIKNRKLAAFQQTAAFYAAMVGLPLSAISSFPEFAMILYQGRGGKDVQRGILAGVKEVKNIFKATAQMKINKALGYPPRANIDKDAQVRLTKAGLFNDDAAIATRLGLGETDVSKAWWQKQFFKYSGIAGITQLQRAIAASAVTGFVSDRIRILSAKPDYADFNQDQLEIYRQLVNLGMDVDGMIDIYRKYNDQMTFESIMQDENNADYKFLDNQMNTATWYFVNDRVQNPQAFNRPLFFQDPHYQLFVQFNGFISTFTANIVPKLWNDYLRNGSPRMQYNTFAMIVTMMAVAGGSQWLKDFIKFGGSSPYLSDAQLLQRALQSSGLLGTGERLLQGALPLYRSRDEGITDRLFGETVGGSPTVRSLGTAMQAIGALGKGETERAAGHATKLIPGVGPITPIRNVITDLVHGKSPDPYPFLDKGE